MAGLMRKRCPACETLQAMTAMRCRGCGGSLIDAPIVTTDAEGSAPSPTPAPDIATSTGTWTCEACHFEQNHESDNVCRLCEQLRASPPDPKAAAIGNTTTTYVLTFPFGDVRFSNDLSIGRDPMFCIFADRLRSFEKVSRRHAIVEVDSEARLTLVDLNSTNGTYVNGTRVEQNVHIALQIGDELSFSKALIGSIGRKT